MITATVTSDYKITLPKELRESMHLQPGQEFVLIQNGSGIQMVPKLSAEQLKAAVAQGLASGPSISATEVFDRLEDKYRKLATGK
ncbi:AbrB/MazE/SpoVT family DNA-binding domain-containing protein [Sideroxydans sp. CL21]|uniref:AbrB/MazE/SpoVT family DNA-binding domain-containing protein n=1 Tax=Sideroxydans sp. CL21 TaxID=2600596 RepID=UPI0024BCE1BE|nr:AbrB/MazE/SpoVT family DNA-binding domain-containing protein [Sideroxydans sp. CL21]